MTDDEIDGIIAKLTPLEEERLTGWKGPPGAAYNVISEELVRAGLLTANWSLSEIGLRVRASISGSDMSNG